MRYTAHRITGGWSVTVYRVNRTTTHYFRSTFAKNVFVGWLRIRHGARPSFN